jgi:hypothetical protein
MRWRRRRRRRKPTCARHRRNATVLSASLRSPRGARHRARRCTGSMPPSSPPSPRHLHLSTRSGAGGGDGAEAAATKAAEETKAAARATATTTRSSRRATAVQPPQEAARRLMLCLWSIADVIGLKRMIGLCSELMASRSVKNQFTQFDTRPDHGKRRARSGGDAAHPDTDRPHHEAQWQHGCEVGTFPARADLLCPLRPRRSTGT